MKFPIVTPMHLAITEARTSMRSDLGGPFGAVIIDPEGQIVAISSNTVLGDHDPTAHAEINAIRTACKNLGTHNLSGCTLYCTGYPCPMCLGAVIWANIEKVYYGCTPKDADSIGFRDSWIYDFIESGCKDVSVLDLEQCEKDECMSLFDEYVESNKQLY